jgi:hypothetical protein
MDEGGQTKKGLGVYVGVCGGRIASDTWFSLQVAPELSGPCNHPITLPHRYPSLLQTRIPSVTKSFLVTEAC